MDTKKKVGLFIVVGFVCAVFSLKALLIILGLGVFGAFLFGKELEGLQAWRPNLSGYAVVSLLVVVLAGALPWVGYAVYCHHGGNHLAVFIISIALGLLAFGITRCEDVRSHFDEHGGR